MREFWCSETRRWVPEAKWRAPARPQGPMILKDVPEHRSPIDGSVLSSRSHRREHMKRHRVVEVGDDQITPRRKELPSIDDDLKRAWEKVHSK